MASPTSNEDIDFDKVPVKALNVTSRMILSRLLNPEQPLTSSNGLARDYRGLAEQMDFEYMDIRNFQRSDDPTLKTLEAWEGKPTNTLGSLISMLTQMERNDVIDDALPQFRTDAAAFIRRNRSSYEAPVQVHEVSSCRPLELRVESHDVLTVDDLRSGGGITIYDAYVCYAEEDVLFVRNFANFLESEQIGLKLFIKGRDLLLGTTEPEAYVQLIQERCQRMLIILSPDFLKSGECEFQASFAAGLAIEQRQRKLIPIIHKPCEVPLILRYVSKIDFTKPDIQDWLWDKLIMSIRGESSAMFFNSAAGALPHSRNAPSPQPEIQYYNSSAAPIITYPPTLSYQHTASDTVAIPVTTSLNATVSTQGTSLPNAASVQATTPLTTTVSAQGTISCNLTVTSAPVAKNTPPNKPKWYQHIKGKFTSLNSLSSSSASSATSGFHSHSEALESGELPETTM